MNPERDSGAGEPIESFEVERKYEVGVEADSPLDYSAVGLFADAPERYRMVARYFDTVDRALARRLVAVRERTGGKDAGWHMKAKGEGGAREMLWPPSQEMPEGLRAEIAKLTRSPIELLAELRTDRTVLRLRDASGAEAVELADDRVLAEEKPSGVRRAWREWEAELMPGADPALLDALEPVLRAAGADPSPSPAKIARATGFLPQLDATDRAAARRLGA